MREHHHPWAGQVPVGEGLVAALMSIMEPAEADSFLADYLRQHRGADAEAAQSFSFRVRAMADWLRREERDPVSNTLQ